MVIAQEMAMYAVLAQSQCLACCLAVIFTEGCVLRDKLADSRSKVFPGQTIPQTTLICRGF